MWIITFFCRFLVAKNFIMQLFSWNFNVGYSWIPILKVRVLYIPLSFFSSKIVFFFPFNINFICLTSALLYKRVVFSLYAAVLDFPAVNIIGNVISLFYCLVEWCSDIGKSNAWKHNMFLFDWNPFPA